jgi:hypothetical protein
MIKLNDWRNESAEARLERNFKILEVQKSNQRLQVEKEKYAASKKEREEKAKKKEAAAAALSKERNSIRKEKDLKRELAIIEKIELDVAKREQQIKWKTEELDLADIDIKSRQEKNKNRANSIIEEIKKLEISEDGILKNKLLVAAPFLEEIKELQLEKNILEKNNKDNIATITSLYTELNEVTKLINKYTDKIETLKRTVESKNNKNVKINYLQDQLKKAELFRFNDKCALIEHFRQIKELEKKIEALKEEVKLEKRKAKMKKI